MRSFEIYNQKAVDYSALFLLIALLVVGAGASSALCSICTPANSGSIMIRPQLSLIHI